MSTIWAAKLRVQINDQSLERYFQREKSKSQKKNSRHVWTNATSDENGSAEMDNNPADGSRNFHKLLAQKAAQETKARQLFAKIGCFARGVEKVLALLEHEVVV